MHHDQELQLIAYQIWEEEGRQHGHDMEHWQKAEAIWQEKYGRETLSLQHAAAPQKAARGNHGRYAAAQHRPSDR